MKSNSKGLILRVGISLSALILVFYFLRHKLEESFQILITEVRLDWFLVAFAIYVMANIVLGFRLREVFRVQKIIMTVGESIYLIFIGLFFNLFFPSAVGGDIAKAYYASQHNGDKLASTAAVITDRLMGFVSLIGMALIAILVYSKELDDVRINYIIYAALILMVGLVVFFVSKAFATKFKALLFFIPSEKWRMRIKEMYNEIHEYRHHKALLVIILMLSFTGQVGFIFTHYFAVRSLDVMMNPWLFFVLVPLISIVSMAPSIGGLGVREAGAIVIFSRFMPTERAFAVTLLLDVMIYGVSFASGIVYALKGGLKAKVIREIGSLE